MPEETRYAKLFTNGQSQAVRLPKEFRFAGTRVRVKRLGDGVVLQPDRLDVKKFFQAIDDCDAVDFMKEGRGQPPMPAEEVTLD